jgi:hypothetical protein
LSVKLQQHGFDCFDCMLLEIARHDVYEFWRGRGGGGGEGGGVKKAMKVKE